MSSYTCENFQLFILYNFQFHHMMLKRLSDDLNSIFDCRMCEKICQVKFYSCGFQNLKVAEFELAAFNRQKVEFFLQKLAVRCILERTLRFVASKHVSGFEVKCFNRNAFVVQAGKRHTHWLVE